MRPRDYEPFGVLAEKISEDDYRVMMGDHNEVAAKLPPEIVQALAAMKPGQVSDLIQFEGRLHRHPVECSHSRRENMFAQVKDSLMKQLQQQKSEQLRAGLDKKLHTGAKVETL